MPLSQALLSREISPFRAAYSAIKTFLSSCVYEAIEKPHTELGKMHASKRPEKTLGCLFGLIQGLNIPG